MLEAVAALAFAAWVYLVVLHGRFWTADQRLPQRAKAPGAWPEVVAVIPARDEAESIAQVIGAHLSSDYPGRFSVILVDDASSDGTAELARGAAGSGSRTLHVLDGAPLPTGWTGKLWAQAQGIEASRRLAPDAAYLLLCDADIAFGPRTLSRLVAKAEAERFDLVTLMARLDARGPWASLLIPAFVFFFQKLYPFPRVNDPKRAEAGAAGGVMLLRREAQARLDLPASIKDALIDDCALGAAVKRGPPPRRVWLGLAEPGEAVSLRDNRALGSIWSMVARTAYAQLGYNPALLAGSVLGMALLYLAPPVLAVAWPSAVAGSLGAAAWLLMTLAFFPMCLDYRRPWAAPLLPLAGALYTGMTLDGALRHMRGKGGAWKGRTYPAAGR